LIITGVNVLYERDTVGEAFQILKENRYTFPTLIIDRKNNIIKELPLKIYPTVIIFDKEGTLVYQGDIKYVDKIIEKILINEKS
jgi:hypothetical protein